MKTRVVSVRWLWLTLIVILALFLRLYRLSSLPPALSWDEASIGYNAYSILKTGRDEHGRFLPLDAFVAFGDYKPPLPIYLSVPTIATFGLNELAVRLPSAIAGVLTVILTYFLITELFLASKGARKLGLFTAFLLAISPWHIQLSRAAFEANIALFFVVGGVFLTLRAKRDPRLFLVCWLPFVATLYTFNSARYFSPILALVLVFYNFKEVRSHLVKFGLGVVIAGICVLPVMTHLLSPQARLRFTEVNIFTDSSIVATANERINVDRRAWWSKALHNRRFGYLRSYLLHFLDNLEPRFLFIKGDGNPKFSLQDVGELYLAELPFLIVGIYWLLVKEKKIFWLLMFWMLGAIVPAATAREAPHALRIENSLPTWQVFIAYGGFTFFTNGGKLIKFSRRFWLLILSALLLLGNFFYFTHNYFNHYGPEYSGEWQYGYREAIRFVSPLESQYQQIILSENIGRPYIYALFYKQFDPKRLRGALDASFDAAGFYNVFGLDKYRFVRGGKATRAKNTLYILPPAEVPGDARVLQSVRLLNHDPVLVIFDFL